MHAGVLTNIQRLQMQAVRPNFQQQRVQQHLRQPAPFIGHQRPTKYVQIPKKISRTRIERQWRSTRRWSSSRRIRALPQPRHHARHQQPNGLMRKASHQPLLRSVRAGDADFVQVSLQQRGQFSGHGNLLRRARKLLKDIAKPFQIVPEQKLPRHLQCFNRRLRRHKRIAVAIAANPRPKRHQQRQLRQARRRL